MKNSEQSYGNSVQLKNSEQKWEEIAGEGLVNYRTHRLRVSGGYLYRYQHNNEAHVLFVPDSQADIKLEKAIEFIEMLAALKSGDMTHKSITNEARELLEDISE